MANMRDGERLNSSCTTRLGRSGAWPRACIAVCAIVVVAMVGASAETPQRSGYELPSNGTVITFLQQSAEWYRHTYPKGRLVDPDDLVFLDDNQPIAVQIVRLSFEFAKADAALATTAAFPRNEPATSAHPNASSSDLARFVALKNQTDTASQKATQDINTLKKKIAEARGADRRKLQAAGRGYKPIGTPAGRIPNHKRLGRVRAKRRCGKRSKRRFDFGHQ
jgi:hypothetical protein